MDWFNFTIDHKDILIYRSVYAPVKSNMFTILTGNEAVVIDPNKDDKLLSLLEEKNVSRVHILLTHEHYDHISGVMWLKEKKGVNVYCQTRCAERIAKNRDKVPRLVAVVLAQQDKEDNGHRYRDFKDGLKPVSVIADRTFDKRDNFKIGNLVFEATATPGHCPGAACYMLFGKMVFTGDSLLQNTPTITRFPESNNEEYEKISLPFFRSLPKDTIIMPGHGDPFILKDTKNI